MKCEMWQSGKKESLDKVSPHIVVCLENFGKAMTYLLISLSRLKGFDCSSCQFDLIAIGKQITEMIRTGKLKQNINIEIDLRVLWVS